MKKVFLLLNILFWFVIYISPFLYGLIIKDEDWKSFGAVVLIAGWIPIVIMADYIQELIIKK